MKREVYLRRAMGNDRSAAIRDLLERCRWTEVVAPRASVVLKLNLCTELPEQIHAANTSLGILRAVCEVVRERTPRITVVESNGARYPAEAAFENNGVYRLAQELN